MRKILYLTLLLAGCGGVPSTPEVELSPAGPVWFQDVTDEVGLDFTHDAGPPPTGTYFMPQIMGSGAALFDCDGDGRLDIFLIQNAGPKSAARNRLFRQRPDGRFTDISAGSGLDVAGYGMGVAVGDVNNDGRPDLLVTDYGSARLFLNRGGGKFEDITKAAGLDNALWGTSAAFVDYDRDGRLDLVLVNYVDYDPTRPCAHAGGQPDYCHPKMFSGTVTRLYRNLGPGPGVPVRFEDVTLKAGLGLSPGPGLGVVCHDLTGDGWPDLFIANDAAPNHLWVNQRDGTFREEAVVRGLAYNAQGHVAANMGVALGDVTGSGRFDLFITHLTEESHTLWRQLAPGSFADRTAASGLAAPRWRGTGFGTVLADFDLDGALDLAIVNGRVARSTTARRSATDSFWAPYEERNQLFANDGAGVFSDMSLDNAPFCGRPGVYRGLAWGDVDGDGRVDLLVTAAGGRARLFRNVAPKRGHWLLVRAIDPALGGRDAYGAIVTLRAGGRQRVGLVNPGHSYLCSSDPRVHFGLGEAAVVESIRVTWPDGSEEQFPGQPADRIVELRKGTGTK